jgi:hypothetical protein
MRAQEKEERNKTEPEFQKPRDLKWKDTDFFRRMSFIQSENENENKESNNNEEEESSSSSSSPPPRQQLMVITPTVLTSSVTFDRCKTLVENKLRQQLPPPTSAKSDKCEEPQLKRQKKKKKIKLSTPSGYAILSIVGKIHEVLISSKGIMQGTTETSSQTPSLISKQSFMIDYLRLKMTKDNDQERSNTYEQLKNNVFSEYSERKKLFLSHPTMQHWKGNEQVLPSSYSSNNST